MLRTFIMLFDLTVSIASASPFSFLDFIEYQFNYFFMATVQIVSFRAHWNDRYRFLENNIASKWPWKLTTSIFFVGIMPTITLPGIETEDGGG